MRIVAGKWRGRRLKPPADRRIRPTADRVREAWMSIVHMELPDARVLDLFSGSGALGLEALSRGAAHVDFVESSEKSLATLRANVDLLGAAADVTVHADEAIRFIERLREDEYDIAFADPPYREGLAERVAHQWSRVAFARILGVEHEKPVDLAGGERRVYGDTVVTIFRTV